MKKRDLTGGSVIKSLLIVAVPTMLTQLLVFSYNIVDLRFVSALGTEAIAAVGSASLFMGIGFSINALSTVGAGIKASQAMGRDDTEKYHKAVNTAYITNTFFNIILGLILFFFPYQLLGILKITDPQVVELAVGYLRILAFVAFFQLSNQTITRVLGSLGLSDKTLYISIVGFGVNIILDPIFIYTLGWGVNGAAFASLIGNALMTILFFSLYYSTLKYTIKEKITRSELISSIRLGVPYMFQRLVFTAIGIWLGRIVASFGTEAIAAQKIGLQVESITFMVIGGMFAAMSSFAGQNLGAGKYDRIIKGYGSAIKIGMAYAFITSLIFLIRGEQIARIFDSNPLTVKYTVYYLQAIAFGQLFAVLEMVGNGLYTGIGKPKIPAMISITITVLRVPLAIILSQYFGVIGIFISIAVTSIMKGIISYGIYKFKISKEIGFTIVSIYSK